MNVLGLVHLGISVDNARTVTQFHFNNVVTLLIVILAGLFILLGADREIAAFFSIAIAFGMYFLLDRINRKHLKKLFVNKEKIRIMSTLFILSIHVFVVSATCIFGYLMLR